MNINTSKSMTACFKTIADNKIKAFEQSLIKNYGFENIYISRNPLVIKHLLIIAIEELNNRLKLKKKKLRVDFNKSTYWHLLLEIKNSMNELFHLLKAFNQINALKKSETIFSFLIFLQH